MDLSQTTLHQLQNYIERFQHVDNFEELLQVTDWDYISGLFKSSDRAAIVQKLEPVYQDTKENIYSSPIFLDHELANIESLVAIEDNPFHGEVTAMFQALGLHRYVTEQEIQDHTRAAAAAAAAATTTGTTPVPHSGHHSNRRSGSSKDYGDANRAIGAAAGTSEPSPAADPRASTPSRHHHHQATTAAAPAGKPTVSTVPTQVNAPLKVSTTSTTSLSPFIVSAASARRTSGSGATGTGAGAGAGASTAYAGSAATQITNLNVLTKPELTSAAPPASTQEKRWSIFSNIPTSPSKNAPFVLADKLEFIRRKSFGMKASQKPQLAANNSDGAASGTPNFTSARKTSAPNAVSPPALKSPVEVNSQKEGVGEAALVTVKAKRRTSMVEDSLPLYIRKQLEGTPKTPTTTIQAGAVASGASKEVKITTPEPLLQAQGISKTHTVSVSLKPDRQGKLHPEVQGATSAQTSQPPSRLSTPTLTVPPRNSPAIQEEAVDDILSLNQRLNGRKSSSSRLRNVLANSQSLYTISRNALPPSHDESQGSTASDYVNDTDDDALGEEDDTEYVSPTSVSPYLGFGEDDDDFDFENLSPMDSIGKNGVDLRHHDDEEEDEENDEGEYLFTHGVS